MKEGEVRFLRLAWYGWLALGAAVAVRLVFIILPPAVEFGSGGRYAQPAADFLAGRFSAPGTIDQLPGAPLFFAACFLLVGRSFAWVAAAQHALGFCSLLLLVRVAQRAWGTRAASLAAVLLSAQVLLAYQECFLLSETVSQFYFAAALFLGYTLRRDAPADWRWWALGGAAAAMAALSRGEFGPLGPVIAAALLLPKPSKALLRRVAIYGACWLLLVGGWRARNQMVGFSGFNPHGMTVLLDSAVPLVRYDLPTQPLVKKIFKEQVEYCSTHPCDPRPTTLDRLINENGYGYVAARQAFGEMAWEAVSTQPGKFAPLVAKNFADYFIPMAWAAADQQEPRSVVGAARAQGPAHERLWRLLEAGPQYAGWLPMLSAALCPLAFWLGAKRDRWTAALMLAGAVCVAGLASIFRTVARTQAELYLPLAVLGAFNADVLLDALTRRAAK